MDPPRYKTAIQVISSIVMVCEVLRIGLVGYEVKGVYRAYPESYTLVFCVLSIILGLLSLGLEALLLVSVKKRWMRGIQPWFLSTFLLFLLGSLMTIITLCLYVVTPLDHNYQLANPIQRSNATQIRHAPSNSKTARVDFALFNATRFSFQAEQVQNMIRTVHLNSTTKLVTGKFHEDEWEVSKKGISHLNAAHHARVFPNTTMEAHPILAISFLLEALRALPQLRLVNRFVKTERLHLIHMHSHGSLAALYVKHV